MHTKPYLVCSLYIFVIKSVAVHFKKLID